MSLLVGLLLALHLVSGVGLDSGHEVSRRPPSHQLSLEVLAVAGYLGYAARVAPNTSVGLNVGLGPDLLSEVPLAGGHFTGDWGLSYEQRDGATNKKHFELAQIALFLRHFLPYRFHAELGARASAGLHADSSDDDAANVSFWGAYVAVFWGGSIVSIGSRVSVGTLSESRSFGAEREMAVVLNPIILKLTTF